MPVSTPGSTRHPKSPAGEPRAIRKKRFRKGAFIAYGMMAVGALVVGIAHEDVIYSVFCVGYTLLMWCARDHGVPQPVDQEAPRPTPIIIAAQVPTAPATEAEPAPIPANIVEVPDTD